MPAPTWFDLARGDAGAAGAAALAALDRGELVVVPTETVYGIAAREDRPAAVARLQALKAGRNRPFSVAVGSLEQLDGRLAPLPSTARRIAHRWWPGPVTLVLGLRGGGTVGVRVPGHPWTRALANAAGVPLLLPSANLPDEPAPVAVAELGAEVRAAVAVVVDGGRAALGEASTVVQPLPAGLRLLREGVVSRADLLRFAEPQVLVVCSGNTCRSPMAERLLQRALERRAERDPGLLLPRVRSRGLHASSGAPASAHAQEALGELGVDLGDHVADQLERALLDEMDVVLCMTAAHRALVAASLPAAPPPLVATFDPQGADVEDPFGGNLGRYRAVARLLDRLAAAWAERLLTPEQSA